MAVTIEGVAAASPAEKAGVRAGMALLAIDGHPIADGLDYEFYQTAENPALDLRTDGGEALRVQVQKAEYQPLGCLFGTYLIDKQHACKNKCVFCFIDQLPKGMRKELYFKDDDERLGFLFGNYITLTNLSEREIERIIEMHISPVNISVHTANPELRVEMMKNKHAGEVLGYIPRLAEAGVAMNMQLVLCPGVNDGPELERTLQWLAGFAPAVQSIAAVPLGLTAHRAGLPALAAYTRETAADTLRTLLAFGDAHKAQTGERLAFPADEFFLLAGEAIPDADFYEGFAQLENGVGMWRVFEDEFCDALAEAAPKGGAFEADVATGEAAAPLLGRLAALLGETCPGRKLHVHAVKNEFFGGGVTVAGLLTGRDIVAQLKGKLQTGALLLPESILRADGDVTLDGMTLDDIGKALGAAVQTTASGDALARAVLG